MNKRLELIASIMPHGRGFTDVGTDHGYLPVYMAQHGYAWKAGIASGQLLTISEIKVSLVISIVFHLS